MGFFGRIAKFATDGNRCGNAKSVLESRFGLQVERGGYLWDILIFVAEKDVRDEYNEYDMCLVALATYTSEMDATSQQAKKQVQGWVAVAKSMLGQDIYKCDVKAMVFIQEIETFYSGK